MRARVHAAAAYAGGQLHASGGVHTRDVQTAHDTLQRKPIQPTAGLLVRDCNHVTELTYLYARPWLTICSCLWVCALASKQNPYTRRAASTSVNVAPQFALPHSHSHVRPKGSHQGRLHVSTELMGMHACTDKLLGGIYVFGSMSTDA